MSIEAQSRCSCSFRSTTDYRSPINGLSEINRFELFYKHCIPTGFPDRLALGGLGEGDSDKNENTSFSFFIGGGQEKGQGDFSFLVTQLHPHPNPLPKGEGVTYKIWPR